MSDWSAVMQTTASHLVFVLVSTLGIACAEDEDTAEGQGGEASTGSTGTTGGEATTGTTVVDPPSISTATFTTADADSSSSTAMGDSADDPETGRDEAEAGETGPFPGELGCDATCALEAECFGADGKQCFAECIDELDPFDRPCIDAIETLYLCLGELTCDEFLEYFEGTPPDIPCATEDAEVGEVCGR